MCITNRFCKRYEQMLLCKRECHHLLWIFKRNWTLTGEPVSHTYDSLVKSCHTWMREVCWVIQGIIMPLLYSALRSRRTFLWLQDFISWYMAINGMRSYCSEKLLVQQFARTSPFFHSVYLSNRLISHQKIIKMRIPSTINLIQLLM